MSMLLGVLASPALTACVKTRDYVIQRVPNGVSLEAGACHGFEYVDVEQIDGGLRIYGKIHHEHPPAGDEGHVELTVLGPAGQVTYAADLPLRHQSRSVRGWAGAAFRAVLPYNLEERDEIRLSFHGEACPKEVRCDYTEAHAAGMMMAAQAWPQLELDGSVRLDLRGYPATNDRGTDR